MLNVNKAAFVKLLVFIVFIEAINQARLQID